MLEGSGIDCEESKEIELVKTKEYRRKEGKKQKKGPIFDFLALTLPVGPHLPVLIFAY